MLNPLLPPPRWMKDLVTPLATSFDLHSLPDHFHEVILTFALYVWIHFSLSPRLSTILFPQHYPKLPTRTRLNWDIHVVSFVQSTVISAVALWLMFTDKERKDMDLHERIYGYTGASGLAQAMATGYFLYDVIVSTVYVKMFGVGMFFHGLSAICVFTLGFRPFINYYTPTFILYELSSPFLNIHWFLDKVDMTGSRLQWYNGMALLLVFFSCRLVWGTYSSIRVYIDIFQAVQQTMMRSKASILGGVDIGAPALEARDSAICLTEACVTANAEVAKFAKYTVRGVPLWLALTYVVSNIVLNVLNYYWFSKMIETVTKRFRNPPTPSKADIDAAHIVLDAASALEDERSQADVDDVPPGAVSTAADESNSRSLRHRKG